MKVFKRILKWTFIILGVLLLAPMAALVTIKAAYWNVVRKTPQGLHAPGKRNELVNVFSATGGWPYMCGLNTPAVQIPFGLVKLGPDTASLFINAEELNRSGYFFGDNKILGFSHTRLVGADAKEGGHFRIFPTIESRVAKQRGKDRYATFSHDTETGYPGHYSVSLPSENVRVELSATARAGAHRYNFKGNSAPHILIDVCSALGKARAEDGTVKIIPEKNEVEGSVKTFGSFAGRYGGLDVYFAARFNEPFAAFGTLHGGAYAPGETEGAGKELGADLSFALRDYAATVEMRIGISCVSIENARMNLDAETPFSKSFEEIQVAAEGAWEDRLNAIRVTNGTPAQRRIFYTALYRTMQMPTIFTDVNGEFRGFDKQVHKAEGYTYYTDFSLWDTFRTVQPLYYLIARKEARDMTVSLVEMAKEGGCLPRWPAGCGYTNCMFGTPADVAVSEAYLKGITDFDAEKAYACMRETGLTGKPAGTKFAGREHLEDYLQYRYCPDDKMSDSVAATLEYGWCDTAIANFARALGKTEDAALFAEHAKWYKNLWNPETTFFQPKDSNGKIYEKFKPTLLSYVDFKREYTRAYVEGSAMQWRWGVPYDAEGLVALFPTKEEFVRELENYFENSTSGVGAWNPGGYYWHGNEPYIHAAYLFNAAGRPDLTQKWARWVMEHKYADTYYGLDGNDDGGTLSAWYVFSALGFYPIAGTTRYEVGSPIFDKAEMKIGDKVLTIIAENNSAQNQYVQRLTINDKPWDKAWFSHEDIANGGTLKFEMGAAAAKP